MKIVVSGFPRSGTSMMMGALIAGGIPGYWDSDRERSMMTQNPSYDANKHGFYEVGAERFMKLGFSTKVPEGCCVKIQAIGLPILHGNSDYKVIMMRRDPMVIKESYQKAFPDEVFGHKYTNWPAHYYNLMDSARSIMAARSDVEMIDIWMRDVIENPTKEFNKLKAIGVELDLDKAIAYIDPEQERFKCA